MHRLREQFLLHRINVAHDTQAFAEIYDVYSDRMTRFIRLKVRRMEDAEELQAELFERAWKSLCETRVRNLSAFLYTIARRVVADHYRRQERLPAEDEIDHANHESSESLEELISAVSDLDLIRLSLEDIYEDYRELIVMRYMDELEIIEISRALSKTPNNVRVSLHRAMGALKCAIEKRSEQK
jgi:RNA polymerase sigma factor (sigma-70 family)